MRLRTLAAALLLLIGAGSCTINFAADTLFPTGTPFVLRGTADLAEYNGGTCLVWLGENGATYHLFQNSRVTNDDFDMITTPGVTARLELARRTDLFVDCPLGTIVEVQNVLEIVP
jgi:hypothetical protein